MNIFLNKICIPISLYRFGGLHSMTSLDSVLLGILESDIPQVEQWYPTQRDTISLNGV